MANRVYTILLVLLPILLLGMISALYTRPMEKIILLGVLAVSITLVCSRHVYMITHDRFRRRYLRGVAIIGTFFTLAMCISNPHILDRSLNEGKLYVLIEHTVSTKGATTVKLYQYRLANVREVGSEFYEEAVGDCLEIIALPVGVNIHNRCR